MCGSPRTAWRSPEPDARGERDQLHRFFGRRPQRNPRQPERRGLRAQRLGRQVAFGQCTDDLNGHDPVCVSHGVDCPSRPVSTVQPEVHRAPTRPTLSTAVAPNEQIGPNVAPGPRGGGMRPGWAFPCR